MIPDAPSGTYGPTVVPEAPSFEELLDLREFGLGQTSQSGMQPSEYVKRMDGHVRAASDEAFDALRFS